MTIFNRQFTVKPVISVLVVIGLSLVLGSCAEPADMSLSSKSYIIPKTGNNTLLSEYSYQQTTGYTCGPSVIMSLLHHYGKLGNADMNKNTEMRIANEMGTTSGGTSQTNMVDWLQKHGFHVDHGDSVSLDMIMDNLHKHIPTIIIWNDWSGHAIMIVGYHQQGSSVDNDKDTLLIVDPSSQSNIVENNKTVYGIDALTPSQLTFNQFSARYFFNPSHTAVGLYIVAVPQ
jgi:hypothetical protein